MTRDLRYDRSAFVLKRLDLIETVADPLRSAPMEVRRLGLSLAIAGWERTKARPLVQLVADWLYGSWGMMPPRPIPQGAKALLRSLEDDSGAGAIRSAAETEAEEFLQAAKVLADAAVPNRGGA